MTGPLTTIRVRAPRFPLLVFALSALGVALALAGEAPIRAPTVAMKAPAPAQALAQDAPAADLKSPTLETLRAKRKGRDPVLLVVRPKPRETSSSRVGFAGATDPGTTVTVNGLPTQVYWTGGFAGAVSLKPGKNSIVIEARNQYGRASKTIEVKRLGGGAPSPLAAQPLRIDDGQPVSPTQDVELQEGDWLQVSFHGSTGSTGAFRIGADTSWLPMTERIEAGKNTGYYVGARRIGSTDRYDKAPIRCRLTWHSGKKDQKSVEKPAKGHVTILDPRSPRIVEIAADFTALYTSSSGRARYGNAMAGIRLPVCGRAGGRYRVRLTQSLEAWVDPSDCRVLPSGESPSQGSVEEITTASSSRGTTVTLYLNEPLPVLVRENLAPPSLVARICGAQARLWWMCSDFPDATVRRLEWEQVESDALELRADLACGQPWGWRFERDGDRLRWTIKGPPRLRPAPGQPLKGLTVIVDAGHGGWDRSAIGPTGIAESQVDLVEARLLAKRLRAAGAEVAMPRTDDHFIPLLDRVRFAAQHHGDLFVSLHNNAVDADADPTARHGTMMLYYHPQSRPLAECIHRRLAALPNRPDAHGVVQADICVLRDQTQMPSVLVEGLFLSHPGEEALLMNGKFLDTLTEAVYNGIVDFVAPGGPTAKPGA